MPGKDPRRSLVIFATLLLTLLLLSGCGDGDGENWTEQHGYGPVEEPVELGDMDVQMAREGLQIFNTYCIACHSMEAPISGPALQSVTEKRTPEFIMNFILNPTENRENHPVGQELDEQYAINMVSMGLEMEDARAIYEYFRYFDEYGENPETE